MPKKPKIPESDSIRRYLDEVIRVRNDMLETDQYTEAPIVVDQPVEVEDKGEPPSPTE